MDRVGMLYIVVRGVILVFILQLKVQNLGGGF